MDRVSAQLAWKADSRVRAALLKPSPPNDKGKVAVARVNPSHVSAGTPTMAHKHLTAPDHETQRTN